MATEKSSSRRAFVRENVARLRRSADSSLSVRARKLLPEMRSFEASAVFKRVDRIVASRSSSWVVLSCLPKVAFVRLRSRAEWMGFFRKRVIERLQGENTVVYAVVPVRLGVRVRETYPLPLRVPDHSEGESSLSSRRAPQLAGASLLQARP